jgi:hypothetical protein
MSDEEFMDQLEIRAKNVYDACVAEYPELADIDGWLGYDPESDSFFTVHWHWPEELEPLDLSSLEMS